VIPREKDNVTLRQHPVAELYEARRRERLATRDRHNRIGEWLAWTRLVVFLLAAVLVWRAAMAEGGSSRLLAAIAGAAVVAFLWLVRRHGREKRRVAWFDALARVNARAASRARRDWGALPDPEWAEPDANHPYADDLDLTGRASLARLLPRVSSAPGRETLRAWMLAPAPPATIRERQSAVAELTPLLDFRDALTALGGRVWLDAGALGEIERWAASDTRLFRRPWLIGLSVALPVATITLGVAAALGVVAWTPAIVSLALSATLAGLYGAKLKRALAPVADKADALQGYAEMTSLVSETGFQSPLLRRLQDEMARGDRTAHKALGSLRVLADQSQVRSSPMLHMVLQWLFLWDFHVTHLVERWHHRYGRHLPAWLTSLGEIESLGALAGLAHGNPAWTFPDVTADAPALESTALGHPLLSEDVRVTNDVSVGPPGTFLLVTGSNMSGKSTLLRAIGLNVVLAQAGAPVCAASFRAPPVALHTSMRIRDSLERGVSYFMAEVLRLRQIVETARAASEGRLVMYLFDEMLQGTNAAERTVAAQRILDFLASAHAIGALATHDLKLLDSPSVAGAAKLVHFREDVAQGSEGPVLHFDFRLRLGPASSTNALKLMELAGLPVGGLGK
jgi:hypothetical protein